MTSQVCVFWGDDPSRIVIPYTIPITVQYECSGRCGRPSLLFVLLLSLFLLADSEASGGSGISPARCSVLGVYLESRLSHLALMSRRTSLSRSFLVLRPFLSNDPPGRR